LYPSSAALGLPSSAQHRPLELRVDLSFPDGYDPSLTPRPRNIYFDQAAIRKVQYALTRFGEHMGTLSSLDDFYEAFLGCFYEAGHKSKSRPSSVWQHPWMSFLSSDELEVC
jgi:hypothetical protein